MDLSRVERIYRVPMEATSGYGFFCPVCNEYSSPQPAEDLSRLECEWCCALIDACDAAVLDQPAKPKVSTPTVIFVGDRRVDLAQRHDRVPK